MPTSRLFHRAGMQRSCSQRQVKKVSVPLVPDVPGGKAVPNPLRNSTSSYGTLGSQEEFPGHSDGDNNGGKAAVGHNFGRVGSPDMAGLGSPRHRNSTGSSSSQASSGFESMKSVSNPYVNVQIHTLRGDSPPSRNSYHSSGSGSSSLGSLERLDESGYASQVNVSEMVLNGIPDVEVIVAWLQDLRYEEYIPLFLNAGYDLPTIARMTPEDLTAIGITKPGHRKRLTSEIHRLNIHDNLPSYKPADVQEWLHCLRLGEYSDTFAAQNYTNLDQISQLSWEDLTDIGVKKLGHLKKFVLALKRLKDLRHSKSVGNVSVHQTNCTDAGRNSSQSRPPGEILLINVPSTGKNTAEVRPYCHQQQPNGQNLSNSNLVTFQQVSPRGMVNSTTSDEVLHDSPSHRHMSQARYHQLIAESQLAPGSYDTFPPRSSQNHNGADQPDCCSFDGRPTVSVKPRPVAKIVAKSKRNSGELIYSCNGNEDCIESLKYESQANYASLNISRLNNANERIYANCPVLPGGDHQQQIHSVVNNQNLSPRRLPANSHQRQMSQPPPIPPKRFDTAVDQVGSRRITNGLYGGMPISGPPNSLAVFQLSSGASLNDSVELSPATSVEEFPPPPSPITCEQTVRALRSMREAPAQPDVMVDPTPPIPGTSLFLPQQQNRRCHSASSSPAVLKKPVVPVMPSAVQPGRNDSQTSIDSASSGDTIPFANENVGTIRQKSPRGSDSAVEDSTRNHVDRRPAAMDIFVSGAIRSDRSKSLKSVDVDAGNIVLDDIGNMLQNLTDELDAMLLDKR